MIIVVVEGLSLSGKTTLCQAIKDHYMQKGIVCKICPHGHLTNNKESVAFYNRGIDAYNAHQFKTGIQLGMCSLDIDYNAFRKMPSAKEDILILDRHYTSQYATATYFGITIESCFSPPERYYEFLVQASYGELCRRALLRGDNHSKLTDYILSDPNIYQKFMELYRYYILEHGNPKEHIVDNEQFQAKNAIIQRIDQLLLME